MTETVDAFYQETNYVTLLIFWLLIDVCLLLLHVSFIFDWLVYFFHYSVLRVRFYNKININYQSRVHESMVAVQVLPSTFTSSRVIKLKSLIGMT